jgi:hypothetical protein
MFKNERGQSTLEYAVVIMILLGAFLATQTLIRRGVIGRWRASMDEHSEQYDLKEGSSSVRETLLTNSLTRVFSLNAAGGTFLMRQDDLRTQELKTGFEGVAAY